MQLLEAHSAHISSFKKIRLPPLFIYTLSLYLGCFVGSSELFGSLIGKPEAHLAADSNLRPHILDKLFASLTTLNFVEVSEEFTQIIDFVLAFFDLRILCIAFILSICALCFVLMKYKIKVIGFRCNKKKLLLGFSLLLTGLIGFGYASVDVITWRNNCIQLQDLLKGEEKSREYNFTGQLVEDARSYDNEKRLIVDIESISEKQLESLLKHKRLVLNIQDSTHDYLQGSRLSGSFKLTSIKDVWDTSKNNQNKYQNIIAQARAIDLVQEKPSGFFSFLQEIRYRALDLFKGSEADTQHEALLLARALLFGERSELFNANIAQDMRTLGLSHVIAVSGAHLILVVSMTSIIVKRLIKHKNAQVAVLIIVIMAYLVLTAFPLSALRAAGLSILALSSYFGKRRAFPLQALSITVLCFMIANPSSSLSLSLQLSVLACLGILVFSKPIIHFLESRHIKLPSLVQESLALSLGSLATTLPLTMLLFNTLPLLVIPANIVASLFMAVICPLGLLVSLSGIIFPFSWDLISSPLILLLKIFCACIHEVAYLPFASYMPNVQAIHYVLLAFVIMIACAQGVKEMLVKNCIAAASALILVVAVSGLLIDSSSPDELIMLNIGQGDAILFRSRTKTLLIDTGAHEKLLLQELQHHHVSKIDTLALTHPDADHVGALSLFKQDVALKEVVLSKPSEETNSKKVQELKLKIKDLSTVNLSYGSTGDIITCGNFSFKVLGPDRFEHEGANEDSLCLMASISADSSNTSKNDWRILLTGDAESEVFDTMLQNKNIAPIDIYKLAHHGAKHSMSDLLAHQLRPKLGLISCGKNNRYGHPKEKTLELLYKYKIAYYRTDLEGSIRILFKGNKAYVLKM